MRLILKIVPAVVAAFLILSGSAANAQLAETLLKRDIATGTKSAPKEFRVYHYFNLAQVYDELKTPAGRQAYVKRYIEQVTEKYWDLTFRANQYINAGPGVYLAVDPYIAYSQKLFGTTMIELIVPAGTRYVNVVQPIPIGKDTLDALINEGYFARHQSSTIFYKTSVGATKLGFYRDTLKHMTEPGFEKFRELVQRVFSAANVQWVEFNWDSTLDGFCRRKSVSAFNYFGARPADGRYNGISLISTDLSFPNQTSAEQDFAARVFKMRSVIEQIQQMKKRGTAVPKDFIVPGNYTAQEFKIIKDMTFSCD